MNIEINLITNAIVNYIQKNFKLDTQILQLISTLIISGLTYLYTKFSKVNISQAIDSYLESIDLGSLDITWYFNRLYYMCILSILGYIIQKYNIHQLTYKWGYSKYYTYMEYDKIDAETDKMNLELISKPEPINTNEPKEPVRILYEIDISNIHSSIMNITKFMNLHPEFFNTNVSHKFINYRDNELYPIYMNKVYFNDTLHDVNGYLITDYKTEFIREVEYKNFTLKLFINKLEYDKKCYMKQIEEYVKYQTKHGDNVKLVYYKVLSKTLVSHVFYEANISQWYKDIEKLKNEFFSEHKEYLFSIMESKLTNNTLTSGCWNNLILWGNAGMGKSSAIYRIATTLKMSIVSVDLSLYIENKKELYALFHGQEFTLPDEQNKNSSKNCIIVLEEFDNCMAKLIEIENMYQYKNLVMKKHFEQKQKEIKNKTKTVLNSKKKKKVPKLNIPSTGMNMNDINMNDYMMQFIESEEDNDDLGGFSQDTRRRDNDMVMVNSEVMGIIKNINEDNKSDILRLGDLLELFQGPVPIKDRLIIATTNHYQKIKDSIPALFRPGRLTPLEFKCLDWESFQELCRYYFNQELASEPFEINIPTSQIIEIAVKYKMLKLPIQEFEKEIKSLIKKVNELKQFKNPELAEESKEEPEPIINDEIKESGQTNGIIPKEDLKEYHKEYMNKHPLTIEAKPIEIDAEQKMFNAKFGIEETDLKLPNNKTDLEFEMENRKEIDGMELISNSLTQKQKRIMLRQSSIQMIDGKFVNINENEPPKNNTPDIVKPISQNVSHWNVIS